MAKPDLRDNRKFLRMKRLLGEPTPHVIGYLECLWMRGYQTGNPIIGDEFDVETAAEYPGEEGKFARVAIEVGFIDRLPDGKLAIHQLYEHAPRYVKQRMKRIGTAPMDAHCDRDESQNDDFCNNSDTMSAHCAPIVSQCAPIERPIVSHNQEPRTKNQEPKTKNRKDKRHFAAPAASIKTTPLPADDTPKEKPPKPPRAERPRDELYDAIEAVTGCRGGHVGKAAAELRKADPPYTPEDVREFGRRFYELCPYAADGAGRLPNVGEVEKYIGRLRIAAHPPPPGARPTMLTPKTAEAMLVIDSLAREIEEAKRREAAALTPANLVAIPE
jgi:hypothetical protein